MGDELFSERVKVGKRTYFFDVKENIRGEKYLFITESKKGEDGNFIRNRILIFNEDMEKFLEGFNKAIDFMKE